MAERIKKPLLSIHQLSLSLGEKSILQDLNFSLNANEILAIVGESGSGKSVTAQAIMCLLPLKTTQIEAGTI